MKKATAEDVAARKRARALFIESKGQASYDDIALQLRLEGLGDIQIATLRQWRSRDIKNGSVKPEELAREFERISKGADRVVASLGLPMAELTIEQKVEAASLADLEDTHARALRAVNACLDRVKREIPNIDINEVSDVTTLSTIAERLADSSIRLHLAKVQVRELQMKLIGASDDKGNAVHAEIIEPTKPAGLGAAVALFRSGHG